MKLQEYIDAGKAFSLSEQFEQIVSAFPNTLAVCDGKDSLTYAVLNEKANQIAHLIRQFPTTVNTPIAILCERTLLSLIGLLGVWKAGHWAFLLDPTSPPAELNKILNQLDTDILISNWDDRTILGLESTAGLHVFHPEDDTQGLPGTNLKSAVSPEAPAILLLTSGSTGQPKGVIRNHRTLRHNIWAESLRIGIAPGDILPSVYPIHHSAALNDVLRPILFGATLALYDLQRNGVHSFASWLIEMRVVALRLQTPLLRAFLDTLPPGFVLPDLRYIRPSSRLLRVDVDRLFSHLPDHAMIGHTLSSTEAGQIAGWWFDRSSVWEGDVVPVGFPLEDKEVFLIDEDGQVVEGEGTGILEVRSTTLASGYWGEPEDSEERFRSDPDDSRYRIFRSSDELRRRPDGMLEWLGRVDRRIKVRGLNVDIARVESALLQIEIVSQAVVVVADAGSDSRLVAYIVPSSEACTLSYLHSALSQTLPTYAIPDRLILLPALPMKSSGKVDMRALPQPDRRRPELDTGFQSPTTPFEQMLGAIWGEVLSLDEIGIHDPFLELGGNSLQAMRIAARVQEEFGLEIPLVELFAAGTVAEMALLLTAALVSDSDSNQFEALR